MRKSTLLTLGLLTASLIASKASAITVFDNGPISGATDAWVISGTSVSDSFTLAGPANITNAQIGLWLTSADVATGLDWSIGSSAFGSDISSGAASLSNAFQYSNNYGFDIYESTFPLSASLGAGTYWLTLQNATSSLNNGVYWDDNDGASQAQDSAEGPIGSESFQLESNPPANPRSITVAPVPEPVSATLLGLAGVGLIGYCVKRRKNVAVAR